MLCGGDAAATSATGSLPEVIPEGLQDWTCMSRSWRCSWTILVIAPWHTGEEPADILPRSYYCSRLLLATPPWDNRGDDIVPSLVEVADDAARAALLVAKGQGALPGPVLIYCMLLIPPGRAHMAATEKALLAVATQRRSSLSSSSTW